jgi:predicted nucleic acid-binding protein
MEVILDTNGLSAWLDGDEELKLKLIDAPKVWLSPVVLGEYRFGIKASRHREVYELKLADLEMDIPTLPIDAATSASYAEIRQALKKCGRPIPWHDVWMRPRQNSMVSELFPVMDILTLCKESRALVGSYPHFFAARPAASCPQPFTR